MTDPNRGQGAAASVADALPYLLTPHEAAKLLGCSLEELRERRESGVAPAFYRVTRRTIRYGLDDVLEAVAA